MHLCTHYAPGSFLKPCLIVDTIFNSKTKETALKFVDALNADHASEIVYEQSKDRSLSMKISKWIVICTYTFRAEAIKNHLELTKHFHNGGSQREWDEGWEPYLELYEKWAPADFKEDKSLA